jgi:hypothetical protein
VASEVEEVGYRREVASKFEEVDAGEVEEVV